MTKSSMASTPWSMLHYLDCQYSSSAVYRHSPERENVRTPLLPSYRMVLEMQRIICFSTFVMLVVIGAIPVFITRSALQ
jgi:hypothetical protein